MLFRFPVFFFKYIKKREKLNISMCNMSFFLVVKIPLVMDEEQTCSSVHVTRWVN